jgi:hypothetical protein
MGRGDDGQTSKKESGKEESHEGEEVYKNVKKEGGSENVSENKKNREGKGHAKDNLDRKRASYKRVRGAVATACEFGDRADVSDRSWGLLPTRLCNK